LDLREMMIKRRRMRQAGYVAHNGDDEKCMLNFGLIAWREEPTQKAEVQMRG
jgi:hypothetical protein